MSAGVSARVRVRVGVRAGAVTAVAGAVGSVLTGHLVGVVVCGVGLVVALVVVEHVRGRREAVARQAREDDRARVRAAAVLDVERTTGAWLAALAASGREPDATECVIGLWEWTCAACRIGADPVQSRDEAAFLAAEHDRVHHGRRPSAHVHQVARLVFGLDGAAAPEVTPWPDAA